MRARTCLPQTAAAAYEVKSDDSGLGYTAYRYIGRLNTDKTKIQIRRKFVYLGEIEDVNLSYGMAQSLNPRYLGTWMSKNRKFGMARKHLANQVKKAAYALIAIMKKLNHPPIPVMLKLYDKTNNVLWV